MADPGSNALRCPGCHVTRMPYDDGTLCAACTADGPTIYPAPDSDATISGPAAAAETVWLDQIRMIRSLQKQLKRQILKTNRNGIEVGYDTGLANEMIKLNRAVATALNELRKYTNKANADVAKMTIEQRVQLALGFLRRKQVSPAMLRAAIAELELHLAAIEQPAAAEPESLPS